MDTKIARRNDGWLHIDNSFVSQAGMACDQVVLRFHWKELPVGEGSMQPLTLQFNCFITSSAELKRREPWRQPFPFFDKSDFTGVPSQRSRRPIKEFEAAIDRAVGESVRADGACGVDFWSALANVRWHASHGAVVSYSFREAATLVAWVREEGDYISWYCSGPPGVVAPWIGEAMAAEYWIENLADRCERSELYAKAHLCMIYGVTYIDIYSLKRILTFTLSSVYRRAWRGAPWTKSPERPSKSEMPSAGSAASSA